MSRTNADAGAALTGASGPGWRGARRAEARAALALTEAWHGFQNDLQMIVSLLLLQSRGLEDKQTCQALEAAAQRVAAIARSRAALRESGVPLFEALEQVCKALRLHARARGVRFDLVLEGDALEVPERCVRPLVLIANELATNALKHGCPPGSGGWISLALRVDAEAVLLTVDDGGPPFTGGAGRREGLGLGLVRAMAASIGARLAVPEGLSKQFEVVLALPAVRAASGPAIRRPAMAAGQRSGPSAPRAIGSPGRRIAPGP